MKVFTTKQAQRLDKRAIEQLGIPSIVLMENAGRLTAQEVGEVLKDAPHSFVCVVCGMGNNGGDGFVVARHLMNQGYKVKVFLIGSAKKLKADPLINYRILKKLKCSIKEVKCLNPGVLKDFEKATLIVDAIFGIGLSREVGAPFKNIIEAINILRKRVICVDVPSGLDASTGKRLGACIKGYQTITFAVLKKGLVQKDGLTHAGKIKVADIGIPKQMERKV